MAQKGHGRMIYDSFWNDCKIVEEFTPEDRYFYLYLMTNPHNSICGCYEISKRQMSTETGYNIESIDKLLKRMCEYQVICYDSSTKEILIVNWYKYNWTSSPKLHASVEKSAEFIKNPDFKEYVLKLNNGDTVSIPYGYSTNTISNTNTNTISNNNINKDIKKSDKKKDIYAQVPLELVEPLKAFEEHRKKLKAPLTDHALELLVKKVRNLANGNTQVMIDILNQSIEMGWKGVFELSKPKGKRRNEFLDILESGVLDDD